MRITFPGADTFPGSLTFPGFGADDTVTFNPPYRVQVVVLEGSLRYSYRVSWTVWQTPDGVWHTQEVPYDGDLVDAFILTRSGPVQVTQAVADELIAAGIGVVGDDETGE